MQRPSEARSRTSPGPPPGSAQAAWREVGSVPHLAVRQRGGEGSASHSTRTRLREPTMNQPDSIQKSRPGLCGEVLPGSRLSSFTQSGQGAGVRESAGRMRKTHRLSPRVPGGGSQADGSALLFFSRRGGYREPVTVSVSVLLAAVFSVLLDCFG